jgi:hypothetical protein
MSYMSLYFGTGGLWIIFALELSKKGLGIVKFTK